MVKRVGAIPDVALSGGCSKNDGLSKAVGELLGVEIRRLPLDPQLVGALGAALISAEGQGGGGPAELPLRMGPGAQTGVLLRRDTHAELGSPSVGSSAFVMWTRDPGLVRDGRITLVGPDFDAAASQALPFGQVLVVGGRELGTQDQPLLEQRQSLSNQLEGYMVKSAPGRLWSR